MLDDLGWAMEGRERRNVVEGGILGQEAGVWRRQVLLIGSLKRHLVRVWKGPQKRRLSRWLRGVVGIVAFEQRQSGERFLLLTEWQKQ